MEVDILNAASMVQIRSVRVVIYSRNVQQPRGVVIRLLLPPPDIVISVGGKESGNTASIRYDQMLANVGGVCLQEYSIRKGYK